MLQNSIRFQEFELIEFKRIWMETNANVVKWFTFRICFATMCDRLPEKWAKINWSAERCVRVCMCVGNVHAYFRFALLYLNWHTVKLGLKLLMRCIPYIYYEDSFAKPLFETPFPMHGWRCAFHQLHADLNDALNVNELEISKFNNRTSQTSILRIIIVISKQSSFYWSV